MMRSVFKFLFVFNEAGSLPEPGAPILVSQASHLALTSPVYASRVFRLPVADMATRCFLWCWRSELGY